MVSVQALSPWFDDTIIDAKQQKGKIEKQEIFGTDDSLGNVQRETKSHTAAHKRRHNVHIFIQSLLKISQESRALFTLVDDVHIEDVTVLFETNGTRLLQVAYTFNKYFLYKICNLSSKLDGYTADNINTI